MIINIKILIRDLLKYISRFLEQILFRVFILNVSPGVSVNIASRLDIGKRISFKKQNPFYPLLLGENSRLEARSVLNTNHGKIDLGKNSRVGINSILIGPIIIGNNTGIAQNVFITGENRKHSFTDSGLISPSETVDISPVVIGDGAWIGANTTILPGVHIGSRVVIGAGSVVTKDIPSDCVAVGNPCIVIKQRK